MYGIIVDNEKIDRIQPRILDMARYPADAAVYGGVTVTPYSPTVGARVSGLRIDGEGDPSPGVRAQLYEALLRYGFLSFEPGTVEVEHFERLVSLFGKAKLMNTPYTPETGKSGQLNTIDASTKKTRMNYIWHMDQVFQPVSPPYTALLGETMPALGGDTLFANATAAYELLDPMLAAYLETLTAVHDADTMGYLTLAYHDLEARAEQRRKYPPIEVPLIRKHPETGRKQIFVNELYTHRILGVSRRTSQALLDVLFDALSAPEVQARHRWENGTALIWDNRTVQHRGVPDFGSQRRVMHRALVLPS
ncbi:TauD/TfdA dioxygenase family protein [Bordetella pseudohinzii]|uniref:Alpha-ketoglutarate-dependent taurine dioxygenase n=1 Tax=Bordetella pseudohinzii TaxID=1331258 RepID=A0A0J6EWM5_9BORD|nr:TauD/TfdA family dioxygenase [Bordetella pseudohinzii]ANY17717.1 taurine catabolism dioxygenase TauD [Bordetella pseudohinzii]KMM24795.1 taurine catabolism dioxygenase TauD [Bordetella pseudohinzii]KXA77944.1 taurine catabolism dioxygenase TauD [Bordetella pseudohinzii]KXA79683.1 taurine catabolism dioxygenase TauD [Bordetella pseudohinzii]CUJ02065.1 Alpha-ketoglutarate-dependent taurine dioxygenase [Bordetella pseudohinzii]